MTGKCSRFQEVQFPVEDTHVPVGRNNIHGIGFHQHAVFHLPDFHAGVALDQLTQEALVGGVQMLNQDKSHSRVRRHVGKELLERIQAAG